MGRGRTTTGMCVASLIATVQSGQVDELLREEEEEEDEAGGDEGGALALDETQYLNGELSDPCLPVFCMIQELTMAGEYKTILQLVTVLSHGKGEL